MIPKYLWLDWIEYAQSLNLGYDLFVKWLAEQNSTYEILHATSRS